MFVRGANPIWFFSNLVGQPFDDTYYAFFLTNDMPYVNQLVYQDPDGTIPWSDPIEFQPSSGLPTNIYGNSDLVYRIEIRQGSSPTSPLIYLIQDYIFGAGGGGSVTIADPLIVSQNLITNPNFSDVFFTSPLTITQAGIYKIAPGWNLSLFGSGTAIISQGISDGASNTPGNPPYYLSINNSGFSAKLIQTFSNNGAIFSHGAVSVAFTALNNTPPQNLTVSYQPSPGGGSGFTINTFVINSSSFNAYKYAIDVPAIENTDTGENAFVNLIFNLPADITDITNIQFTGQSTNLTSGFDPVNDAPPFNEISYERITDQEFNVYKNSILTQVKENLLTGWTFALNPYQFITTTITNVPTFGYVADQTIIVQQSYVNSATGNSIATGQGTAAQNYPFVVQSAASSNQFAMIQYIDSATIAPYWNQLLSAMINANLSLSNSSPVKFKMRLIYRTTVPPTMTQNEPISSWTFGNDPVFAFGWTAISPLNDPMYTLTNANQNFSFDQFQLPPNSSDTMTLGIVIYTVSNLDNSPSQNSILFNRVSLVNNDFAIDASTETWDSSLRKCQYYYEKSYEDFILPGTASDLGILTDYSLVQNTGGFAILFPSIFSVKFKQVKRIPSLVHLYSFTSGAFNTVVVVTVLSNSGSPGFIGLNVNANNWTQNVIGTVNTTNSRQGVQYSPTTTNFLQITSSTNVSDQGFVFYHYTSDARMGLGIG